MGSFSMFCSLTQLPIDEGLDNRVVAFLLSERPVYGDGSSPDFKVATDWVPISLPIRGKHDSYGRVDFDESPLNEFLLESWRDVLAKNLIERGMGSNQCHDVPVRTTDNIDQLLEAIQEGRLLLRSPLVDRPAQPNEKELSLDTVRQILRDSKICQIADDINDYPFGSKEIFAHCHLSPSAPAILVQLRDPSGNVPKLRKVEAQVAELLHDSIDRRFPGAFQVSVEAAEATRDTEDYVRDYSEKGGTPKHLKANHISIQVREPAYQIKDSDFFRTPHKHLRCALAMVREDVWNAVLASPTKSGVKSFFWGGGKEVNATIALLTDETAALGAACLLLTDTSRRLKEARERRGNNNDGERSRIAAFVEKLYGAATPEEKREAAADLLDFSIGKVDGVSAKETGPAFQILRQMEGLLLRGGPSIRRPSTFNLMMSDLLLSDAFPKGLEKSITDSLRMDLYLPLVNKGFAPVGHNITQCAEWSLVKNYHLAVAKVVKECAKRDAAAKREYED